jgi:hypothetical protein
MDNEAALNNLTGRQEKASETAFKEVLAMNLPKEVDTSTDLFETGDKVRNIYRDTRSRLIEEFGPRLPQVIGTALHEYWFACWKEAAFIRACIDEQVLSDNEYNRSITTGIGYAAAHGWANTLSNIFDSSPPDESRKKFLKDLTGNDILEYPALLQCMSIYWFNEASKEIAKGNIKSAFDLNHEAHDALNRHESIRSWDLAWEAATGTAKEISASKVRSELAAKAAHAAHAENRALKAAAKEYWLSKISPSTSNDDAAATLVGVVPVTFRTRSRWVSEFKRTSC